MAQALCFELDDGVERLVELAGIGEDAGVGLEHRHRVGSASSASVASLTASDWRPARSAISARWKTRNSSRPPLPIRSRALKAASKLPVPAIAQARRTAPVMPSNEFRPSCRGRAARRRSGAA